MYVNLPVTRSINKMARAAAACSLGDTSDNQEVQNVLQYYLNLFKNDYSTSTLDAFAANCIIDWFGVSKRKSQKFVDFLRYEIKAQLKHTDFNEAKRCEAIEVKPLHMTTRQIPNPNDNKKAYIDSDTEDDEELAMEISPKDNTSLGITPLAADECSNEAVDTSWLHKRHKNTQAQIESKRCKTVHKDNDDETSADMTKNYSALQYIVAHGRLLSLNSNIFDRNVRLCISYRKCLTDDSIQFALVIYEKLQENGEPYKISRRKLNFDAIEESDEHDDEHETALTRPTTPLNTTTEIAEEGINLDAFLALRTPTKVFSNPPTTPRRRRRDISSQHLKRSYTAGPPFSSTDPETPRKPAKKCNAARTLRL